MTPSVLHWRPLRPAWRMNLLWTPSLESGSGLPAGTEPTFGDRLKDHCGRQDGARLDCAARPVAAHGFDSFNAGTRLAASNGLESTPSAGQIGRAHV